MTVKIKKKSVSVNPLKVSQPLGGSLALQGFYRSIPILHGSQGCASFAKTLLTRHYRETIAMQTTALQEMNVIFGAGKSLFEALDTIIHKLKPDLIGVLSTGLTEVAGDDLVGNINEYIKERNMEQPFIIPVSLPDYQGSLESGYAKTVEAIVGRLLESKDQWPTEIVRGRVNLLPASHLTPGDVMEIKEIIRAFGLEVISIPDLSTSLSGHLITGFSPLSRGGIPLDALPKMITAERTLVIGASMEKVAKKIEEAAEIPYHVFPSLTGLEASDRFFTFLQSVTGHEIPLKYVWQRENLLDSMLDAHFYFAGKSAVVALEPDLLYSVITWLHEMGVDLKGIVTTESSPVLMQLDEEIWVGDLGDLEEWADGVDLWISNSHGKRGAKRKGAVFMPLGFPIFDRIGASLFTGIGYRGTTELVIQVGNLLMEKEEV
ncbi:nitrogenase iron-molybdenum cofactor biosynthesis protein NifN [Thermicanus aegyptius]|uniref:nitrogenase iron-molybdenum cofactor biosynthesis protein NifN n=1 Tax=Thermicanus aegyptius TaxID=94009 RepID=UPI00041F7834|nr:nitrogenase iron-molybdenum cofactor biosynthesis protein NifN [Thermicanus aegyptius]